MATGKIIIEVPVSVGEMLDKITILRIKRQHITDTAKQANVINELSMLMDKLGKLDLPDGINELIGHLQGVNQQLWVIEDDIRLCEKDGDFGEKFVKLARSVYAANDRRAEIKREINDLTGSALVEEKSYKTKR